MDWRDRFYQAIQDWLVSTNRVEDIREVTLVEQELPSPYYCDTCGPDPITVTVYYNNNQGGACQYSYYGDLGELINSL